MLLNVIPNPGIDPVAISIGPIDIRWYGLAYAAGLILGWLYIRSLLAAPNLWGERGPPIDKDRADDLVIWLVVGVVLGGRLGQVLLYDPGYYAAHPAEILMPWKGGMSFHGALVGSILAMALFARRHGINALSVMDLAAAAIPIGMLLGRIANFINGEHFGRPSDVPWAMVFPDGGPLARHPSQLYEALLEGLVMFAIVRFATHRLTSLASPGLTGGVWLVWYAIARSLCEIFREPEAAHMLNLGPLTAGQLYSLPMALIGVYLIARARREHQPDLRS